MFDPSATLNECDRRNRFQLDHRDPMHISSVRSLSETDLSRAGKQAGNNFFRHGKFASANPKLNTLAEERKLARPVKPLPPIPPPRPDTTIQKPPEDSYVDMLPSQGDIGYETIGRPATENKYLSMVGSTSSSSSSASSDRIRNLLDDDAWSVRSDLQRVGLHNYVVSLLL